LASSSVNPKSIQKYVNELEAIYNELVGGHTLLSDKTIDI
jgi:hypothetical protein